MNTPEPTECPSCHGLNTSCPDGCGRDPTTGELNGTRLSEPTAGPKMEAVMRTAAIDGTEHKYDITNPAGVSEMTSFEEAFQLIFEAYSRAADTFHDYESWAVWQHGKVTAAFGLLQKVRAALQTINERGEV